ncbi:CHRD superfamily protein [Emericellopsis atlantica]|uniref:CHRD superfamily protein n=1 Tax=Emericellopsis atlantica TaxID=2614577 RepID=A0A9P7ZDM7_9HYPO|nr:CHRD superfamily protein [Emericellopsis atlantica]KAG9250149.1 CHRD superfamily protein [Emericellopsis atlantica]
MKSVAALALVALAGASPMARDANGIATRGDHKMAGPFTFTSTFNVIASPNQVVNSDNEYTGGLEGCTGQFNFGINSHENVICYNITIDGFQGDYESPADTATHIHEAMVGMSGPPRIAFPNPVDIGEGRRNSIGCIRGPFTTGVLADGTDTGEGFHVSQIEENPAAFFSDTHSSLAVPGATRGQLGGPECK